MVCKCTGACQMREQLWCTPNASPWVFWALEKCQFCASLDATMQDSPAPPQARGGHYNQTKGNQDKSPGWGGDGGGENAWRQGERERVGGGGQRESQNKTEAAAKEKHTLWQGETGLKAKSQHTHNASCKTRRQTRKPCGVWVCVYACAHTTLKRN